MAAFCLSGIIFMILVYIYRKWNILSKVVAPRVTLSVRFIISELEETEREENFRIKRFKESKIKKNRVPDDIKRSCYCDKKPGKGDDFKCEVCNQQEYKSTKAKKKKTSPSCVAGMIGDKPSTLYYDDRKFSDDFTINLENIISLTDYCKTEGLISPYVDTFIYACNEVICKSDETDQAKDTCNESNQNASCDVCESIKDTPTCNTCKVSEDNTKDIPCGNSSNPKEIQGQKPCECQNKKDETEGSFGCFETKYKEIVKVQKMKNEDGTVSEQKQVITVKIEKKCPQNCTALDENLCCKIKSTESFESKESKKDSHHRGVSKSCCQDKESKIENVQCCTRKEPERSCICDLGENNTKATITLPRSKNCNICETATDPTSPSPLSLCCNKKCPSVTEKIQTNDEKSTECCKTCGTKLDSKNPSVASLVCCPNKCPSATLNTKSTVIEKKSKTSNKTPKKDSAIQEKSCLCKLNKKPTPKKTDSKTPSNRNSSQCCKVCDSTIKTKTPSATSHTCCPSKCPSATGSIKSKKSEKLSKCSNKTSNNDFTNNENTNNSCLCKDSSNIARDKQISKCCETCHSTEDPIPPSVHTCCPNKCLSAIESNRSKVSSKTSHNSNKNVEKESRKNDTSCVCDVEKKSVCCDAIRQAAACSTTELEKHSEENEEFYISIQEPGKAEENKKIIKLTVKEKSSSSGVYPCCQQKEVEKKQSRTCSLCSKSRNVSTTTSNIDIEKTVDKEKPILVKKHSCQTKGQDEHNKKMVSTPKTSCKIKIISKEKRGSESNEQNVQEIVFIGNVLEAIKKILTASVSDENCNKGDEGGKNMDSAMKSCSCTSRGIGSSSKGPSAKSSVKSSVCQTCKSANKLSSDDEESSTYVSCKCIERSQSCPQCRVKNDKQSVNLNNQRSKSDGNACLRNPEKNVSLKSMCSACCSETSRATSAQRSFTRNSSKTDKDLSCADSCTSVCKNKGTKSALCECQSHKVDINRSSTSTIPSTCKCCQTGTENSKPDNQRNCSRPTKTPPSCPRCEANKEQRNPEGCPCSSVSQNASRGLSKPPQSCPVCDRNQERQSEEHTCCSVPNTQKPLCCRDGDSSIKETTEKCCEDEGKKDASTFTKRTDRYDVRPLKMVKSQKKSTCNCHSDSYLLEIMSEPPKRSKSCSWCHGEYH